MLVVAVESAASIIVSWVGHGVRRVRQHWSGEYSSRPYCSYINTMEDSNPYNSLR